MTCTTVITLPVCRGLAYEAHLLCHQSGFLFKDADLPSLGHLIARSIGDRNEFFIRGSIAFLEKNSVQDILKALLAK